MQYMEYLHSELAAMADTEPPLGPAAAGRNVGERKDCRMTTFTITISTFITITITITISFTISNSLSITFNTIIIISRRHHCHGEGRAKGLLNRFLFAVSVILSLVLFCNSDTNNNSRREDDDNNKANIRGNNTATIIHKAKLANNYETIMMRKTINNCFCFIPSL